jgi:transcription elongation factor Elf1
MSGGQAEPAKAGNRRRVFIFVGGMQPKKVKVDGKVHRCPHCQAQSLRWVRQDLYLSLFFLPIFPFKTGEPYLECEACGQVFHAEEDSYWTDVWYWTTATEECLDGRTDVTCVPYTEWVNAWTALRS